jgi:hypothetical protein
MSSLTTQYEDCRSTPFRYTTSSKSITHPATPPGKAAYAFYNSVIGIYDEANNYYTDAVAVQELFIGSSNLVMRWGRTGAIGSERGTYNLNGDNLVMVIDASLYD